MSEEISRQYDSKDNLAETYAKASLERAERDPGRTFLRQQMENVPRNASVVDVGCGSGIDLEVYKKMGFADLRGVEPSEKFREEAKKHLGEGVKIENGTFESLPLADASIDVVVSRFAMHYVNDLKKALTEVARVLKPGGKFFAVVSHPDADAKVPQNPDGTITISLFNKKVTITFPLHTRDEYFGGPFQHSFDKPFLFEYVEVEQDRDVSEKDQPNALCFATTRK